MKHYIEDPTQWVRHAAAMLVRIYGSARLRSFYPYSRQSGVNTGSLTAAALHESPFVSIPTPKDLGPACAMNCLEISHSRLLCLGHFIRAVSNAATKPEVNQVGATLWPRAARGRIIRLHICNGSSSPALFVVGVLVQLAQITKYHWRFCHEILHLSEPEPLKLHNLHFIPRTHHERRHPRYWA